MGNYIFLDAMMEKFRRRKTRTVSLGMAGVLGVGILAFQLWPKNVSDDTVQIRSVCSNLSPWTIYRLPDRPVPYLFVPVLPPKFLSISSRTSNGFTLVRSGSTSRHGGPFRPRQLLPCLNIVYEKT